MEYISLQKWAREKEIWREEPWIEFLQNEVLPFYKVCEQLAKFSNFLRDLNNAHLYELIEELKTKMKVALYGGIGEGKDPQKSFAKFMYRYFGVSAGQVKSFKESIENYRNFGESAQIYVRDTHLTHPLSKRLKPPLQGLLRGSLKNHLNGPHIDTPLTSIDVDSLSLLPNPGETPEKLINLVSNYKRQAIKLSIGVNPYTTFIFYSRAIPLAVLKDFLGCEWGDVYRLGEFLGYDFYSMTTKQLLRGQGRSDDIFMAIKLYGSWARNLLDAEDFIFGQFKEIEEIYNKFLQVNSQNLHLDFTPWETYEPIVKNILDNANLPLNYKYGGTIRLEDENGWLVMIEYQELPKKVLLRDFIFKMSPLVQVGLLHIDWNPSVVTLKINREYERKLLQNVLTKVVENGGKI